MKSSLVRKFSSSGEHGPQSLTATIRSPQVIGHLDELLESLLYGVFSVDEDWALTYANTKALRMLGCEQLLSGHSMWEGVSAATQRALRPAFEQCMQTRIWTEFVMESTMHPGHWHEVHACPNRTGITVTMHDVTQRRGEEGQLRLLQQVVQAVPMGISVARIDGDNSPLIYVNTAFEHLTEYPAEEALGEDCRFLQGRDENQEGRAEIVEAIRKGTPVKVVLRNYTKSGQMFKNELSLSQISGTDGKPEYLVGIQQDVTEQLEARERLAQQAQYDALTGLANRYLLVDRLKDLLARAVLHGNHVAVVIVDLDNFKHINDRFGHIEADRLLVQVGGRLKASMAVPDVVARLGGDEFALVFSDWPDLSRLEKALDKILIEIRRPLRVFDQDVVMTGSAGIAIFGTDSLEPQALMQMADLAMYSVKRSGKNSSRFYSPALRFNDNEPLDVAMGLRQALAEEQFVLRYQPRVDSATGQVVGFEALVRWLHPERGLLLPAQFVRIAEDTGLIQDLGQWVLEKALAQNAAWRVAGLHPVTMSVNVSAIQIRDPKFPSMVAAALLRSGLPADSLELELTESLLIENAESANKPLRELKGLGLKIAIDDFGTGYSGLQYLSQFPIDTIKVDHFFTETIATNKTAATICQSVLLLGQALGMRTVAEGVESEEQAALLRQWRCSEMQGYLFAQPLTGERAGRKLLQMQ